MSEAAFHRSVAQFLRVVLKPPTVWTSIGHGGGGKVRGAQLKEMGLAKGWPDVIILHSNIHSAGHPIVVGIELKTKKGVQSAEQKALQQSFNHVGANYYVCREIEEVHNALKDAGVIA